MKPYTLSIHLFRRDLRLDDNTALMAALSKSEAVIPIFIFDERQLSHPFKSDNAFQFMLNSLLELDQQLREMGSQLYFFKGIPHEIIDRILSVKKVEALFLNRDYTPFSRERDQSIANVCEAAGVHFNTFADALLNEPEQVHKDDGKPYTVFTPFMKKAKLNKVALPVYHSSLNFFKGEIDLPERLRQLTGLSPVAKPHLLLKGGRAEGLHLLKQLGILTDYDTARNLPSVKGTTLLSAHHKFGTVSVRESYHQIAAEFGTHHTLLNELYWRDFFTHIVWHFPRVLGNAFHQKYDHIPWENDEEKFGKWCTGQTGFPIVDAGMRELVSTGFMHNRVRMIAASFLTKDLHIDWRWGERFFANHLTDYDPAVNNGNWQWAASTGCDAQPYFRVFNPWSQQLKFDPDAGYIKKWIPELNALLAKEIHRLETSPHLMASNYPRPMVEHGERARAIKLMFKRAGEVPSA